MKVYYIEQKPAIVAISFYCIRRLGVYQQRMGENNISQKQ